jgi:hypothetical protein
MNTDRSKEQQEAVRSLRYYAVICLYEWRETTRDFFQNSQSSGEDLNPRPLKWRRPDTQLIASCGAIMLNGSQKIWSCKCAMAQDVIWDKLLLSFVAAAP